MSDAAPDSERQQKLLARFGRQFAAGEVVFRDGDPATEAFLLQKGRVRLIKQVGGVERSLRVLRPGDLFGESALLPGAPRTSTALALEEVVALALDQNTLRSVIATIPEIGGRVVEQIVRRLRDAEDQIEILMVHGTQTKVVVALLKLSEQAAAEFQGPVALSVSPLELSVHVGLDVDTVRQNVRRLRDAGYVNIVDERVEVPDVDALRELYGLLQVKGRISGAETDGANRATH